MALHDIVGPRILVIEDEYYLADDVRLVLLEAGVKVLGPVATLGDARDLLGSGAGVDGVFLDVNLRGSMAFCIADDLLARDIPFAFTTGYDRASLPSRFAGVLMLQKPIPSEALVSAAQDLVARPVRPIGA